ncbi:MAG: glycosyltransferase [Spirochaetota bacterium]
MESRKKILILTADAGFGHRSAASAIEAAIGAEGHGDCEVLVVDPFASKKTPAWLRRSLSDYDLVARNMPELYKLGYDLSDMMALHELAKTGLSVCLFRSVREALHEFSPDAIIVTFPFYLPPLASLFAFKRRSIPVICVVTDLAEVHKVWFNEVTDLTVVPTTLGRKLAIKAGLAPGRVEVIGIPVHPKISAESRSKAELRAELGWKADLTTVLVVGSKRVKKLLEMMNVLNHSGLPIQVAIAAGGDDALYARLRETQWHLPVHIYNFVRNLPTMMRGSDIMISKAGGLVVTESLAAGLPLIIIDVLPGQEIGNAEFVVKGRAGEVAREPVDCLQTIRHWIDDDGRELKARAASALELGRPHAAHDIAVRSREFAISGLQRKDSVLSLASLRDRLNRVNEPVKE